MKSGKFILIIFILVFIYFVGVQARFTSFNIRGHSYNDLFSVESAQHVRHAKMIAAGVSIPRYEKYIQHPNGYDTRLDTIQEEYIAGWLYRFLPLKHIPFDTFIHYFVPFLFCIGIFGIYGITKEISKSTLGGLYAAAYYAIAMASIERSTGDTFIREHLAIPILIFQLWFMVRAFEHGRWRDYIIAGILYFFALSSWRVLNFFTLVLFSFFALAYLLNYHRKEIVKMLSTLTICIILGAFVFDSSIRYDSFLLSKQMFLSYTILLIAIINYWKGLSAWKNIGLFFAIMAIFISIPLSHRLYNHVWETMFFQLRYLGNKPTVPSLLPFDARHYWVPPYTSPSLFRFLNEMLVPILIAGYGIFLSIKRFKKSNLPLSLFLLFYLCTCLFFYYLFSFKIKVFVIIFLVVFMGHGLAKATQALKRKQTFIIISLMIFGLIFQVYQVLTWKNSLWIKLLRSANIQPREFTKGIPLWAIKDSLNWIKSNTLPGEVFVSNFNTSPMVAYYANRPTVIHAYFESDVLDRFREFSYALFSESEKELLNFFKKYHASYLFLTGRELLDNDYYDVSFRYITDNLRLNNQWVVYKLHFSPYLIKSFSLVYQNQFVRIFKCNINRTTNSIKDLSEGLVPPIFDEKLFKQLSPDNTGKYWENAVVCYYYINRGKGLFSKGNVKEAEIFFKKSLLIIPTFEAYNGLKDIYLRLGDEKKAERAFEISQSLWHD
ncbi:MAG: hypothetical protein ABIA97_04540 [Candidatus Omnitrophota bacterium]